MHVRWFVVVVIVSRLLFSICSQNEIFIFLFAILSSLNPFVDFAFKFDLLRIAAQFESLLSFGSHHVLFSFTSFFPIQHQLLFYSIRLSPYWMHLKAFQHNSFLLFRLVRKSTKILSRSTFCALTPFQICRICIVN